MLKQVGTTCITNSGVSGPDEMLQFALFAKTKTIFRTEVLKGVKKQRCPILKAIIVKKGEAIEERHTCIYK